MSATGGTGKGAFGEKAVFQICEQFYQQQGGILYHSYTYKTDENEAGNIYSNGGKLYIENLGPTTEIDVLLVTPYRLFPIEVKAYKAKKITLSDDGISGCMKTDKSPVHQHEMHCRHLYASIFKDLPEGNPKFIVPLVCFVDECYVVDKRSDWQKDYIYLTVLNTLKSTINKFNTPLDYRLNLQVLDRSLKNLSTKCEKYLPCRDLSN